MSAERVLTLSEGQIIGEEARIERELSQRELQLEKGMNTSPNQVVSGIDLSKASLSKEERNLFGILEIRYGNEKPLERHLFEVPDITMDMTPEAGDLPRTQVNYRLISNGKNITIDALYNWQTGEYGDHYGDDETIGAIVEKNLLEALHEKNWKLGHFNAWSVAK